MNGIVDRLMEGEDEGGKFDKAMTGVAGTVDDLVFVFGALAGVIAATNGFLNKATEEYAQLQDTMVAVKRIAGLTGEDVEALTDKFTSLAIATGQTQEEIAKFAETGARFGLKGEDEINSFAETMSRFGAVAGGVTEATVKQFARINTLTGGTADDFDNLANALVVLGNNFATSEDAIARTASRLAQDLAQFEVSSEFVLGLGTAMDALGINAERGGTAMQRLTANLSQVREQGGPVFESLASLAGQTAVAFDEMVKADPAAAALELARNGAETNRVMELLSINSVRANAVFGALSKNSDTLGDAMDLAADKIQGTGDLMEQSELQANSLANVLKRVENAQKAVNQSFARQPEGSIVEYNKNWLEALEAIEGSNRAARDLQPGLAQIGDKARDALEGFSAIRAVLSEGLLVAANGAAINTAGLISTVSELGQSGYYNPIRALTEVLAEAAGYDVAETSGAPSEQATTAINSYRKNLALLNDEKARSATVDEAAAAAQLEANRLGILQSENYDKNTVSLQKYQAALKEATTELSADNQINQLAGVAKEVAQIQNDLQGSIAEASGEFSVALQNAVDTGQAQDDIDEMINQYSKFIDTLQQEASIKIDLELSGTAKEIQKLTDARDQAARDLRDFEADLTVNDTSAVEAATSQQEAQQQINAISASNKEDVERVAAARKQRETMVAELIKQNKKLQDLINAQKSVGTKSSSR